MFSRTPALARTTVAAALLALLLVGSYAVVAGQAPTPESTPAQGSKATQVWDGAAVWPPLDVDLSVWEAICGKPVGALSPEEGRACAPAVMQQAGASPEAMDFFGVTGYFLDSFEELGPVDYGRGSAPWSNMGRPTQQLFLNGTPAIVEAPLDAVNTWKHDPSYAGVLASDPYLSVWWEYGTVEVSTVDPQPGLSQLVEMAMPLRSCRACAEVGYVSVRYLFDPDGSLVQQTVLPLTLATS
jgi:hypothetical protein